MSDRVYFIKPIGFDGPVKIGLTGSMKSRLSGLGAMCPFPLEVIAELEGDFRLERRFHALFGLQHKQREWFEWTPKMAEVVAAINAGTFDINTLPPPKSLPSNRGKYVRSVAPTPRENAA